MESGHDGHDLPAAPLLHSQPHHQSIFLFERLEKCEDSWRDSALAEVVEGTSGTGGN